MKSKFSGFFQTEVKPPFERALPLQLRDKTRQKGK